MLYRTSWPLYGQRQRQLKQLMSIRLAATSSTSSSNPSATSVNRHPMTIGCHQRAILRFFGGDAARLRLNHIKVDSKDTVAHQRQRHRPQRHNQDEGSAEEHTDLFGFFRPFAVGIIGYLSYDAFLDDDEYAFS